MITDIRQIEPQALEVRKSGRVSKERVYMCAHTNASYSDLADAMAHSQCGVQSA